MSTSTSGGAATAAVDGDGAENRSGRPNAPASGTAGAAAGLEAAAWRALGEVLDPELDQPVTDLGFVAACEVVDGEVRVELRLPTYFCAPNFAYLMVADAREALAAVAPGPVRVRLLDHFASEEINAGVAVGDGFDAAFPGLAAGELDDLRATFLRKAHAAYQQQIAARLLKAGRTHAELVRLRLGELAEDTTRLRRRRRQLGLPSDDSAPLLVDDQGGPVDAESLPLRLRFARTTQVSIEGNAGWCRGLLGTRYGDIH
ncbi:iron-sulfur cluster assembly protein [Saccharopolyspora erythraea]|uniref:iron-sulfur cluster assembly protein n=1 Tax=Saccharopolyspora erythraea TaxID=1836 RepID=UPI001BA923AD|nr:iron-sulfur cluster assembly protein [Saccharopolyspora erythraea]QUH04798.1 iron-sulfur cluster assembly protein [Saccharopolyspora erythraea]